MRIRTRSYTAPATFTVALNTVQEHVGGNGSCGIGFRDSGAGTITTMSLVHVDVGQVSVQNFNSPTSFSSTYSTVDYRALHPEGKALFQIEDNNTNFIFRVSGDAGNTWGTVHTVSRTDFLTTPDEVFFFAAAQNGDPVYTHLISWLEE